MRTILYVLFLLPKVLFSQSADLISIKVKRLNTETINEHEIQITNNSDSILFIAISPYYNHQTTELEMHAYRVENGCNVYSTVHFRGDKEIEARIRVLDRIAIAPRNSMFLKIMVQEELKCNFLELEYFFDSYLDTSSEKKILGKRGWFTKVDFRTKSVQLM